MALCDTNLLCGVTYFSVVVQRILINWESWGPHLRKFLSLAAVSCSTVSCVSGGVRFGTWLRASWAVHVSVHDDVGDVWWGWEKCITQIWANSKCRHLWLNACLASNSSYSSSNHYLYDLRLTWHGTWPSFVALLRIIKSGPRLGQALKVPGVYFINWFTLCVKLFELYAQFLRSFLQAQKISKRRKRLA